MMTDPWQGLTEIQQTYLLAIFESDQAAEAYHREHKTFAKASEWRWLAFNRSAISDIPMKLRHLKHTPAQSRPILEALEQRGLIQQRHQDDAQGRHFLAVQMTRDGRALVRAATGTRRSTLTQFQEAFAHEVAQLGLATLEEARTAFHRRDDALISAWKPSVQALRAKRRDDAYPMVIKTVPCAWCGAQVEVKAIRHGLYHPEPVRRVHLAYDGQDHWIEQYGCSKECNRQIRQTGLTVAFQREVPEANGEES
jgi:DNA-binding PadR family transcriptional regulator